MITVATGPLGGVRLNADASDAVERSSQTAGDQRNLGFRVLLAEDGPDNQRLIAFVLRKAGCNVVVAADGRLAVDLALTAQRAGNPFDVILMDIQMPVMDGYEATQQLRRAGCRMPIIALTAHAMAGDRRKCVDAGCDDYVSKPIDRTKLVELLRAWVAKARAGADAAHTL
jgi:two-component system, sensor histidine kinase and response regulator